MQPQCLLTLCSHVYARHTRAARILCNTFRNSTQAASKHLKEDAKGSNMDTTIMAHSDPSTYIFELGGPLLLTAPHGIALWRGGWVGFKKEKHLDEVLVSEIVLKLAKRMSTVFGVPASFMVWNVPRTRPYDERNLDPNFLPKELFGLSPWHQALESFRSYGCDVKLPILHVDIHGKRDRKSDLALDVGMGGMKAYWKDKEMVTKLRKGFEESFTNMLGPVGIVKNGMPFTVDMDPEMSGFRLDRSVFTLSTQSAMLGIPSVQLEIPKTMRQKLNEDDDFLLKFADCIMHVFEQGICQGALPSRDWYSSHCRTPATDIDRVLMELKQHQQ
ncbi:uncharacterized protein LOC124257046 [Haliotis rubra]|uniref:uncharacterized protein LOC124257046 n=1 Tax=Haliotis rubra TaxID=36100 RepID=UPI001EE5D8D1|nr:uncharacterized protein LOC124257046 [Haliotis rubra]XP_046547081.1 uncharacterized protein LOC124257046 [Haliotis rubra]